MTKLFYISISAILFLTYFTQVAESNDREISPNIRHLINTYKNNCSFTDVPYCYKFKAIVNIDRGYLRVWKSDSEGKSYVAGKLEKGEIIYVRNILKYNGKEFAVVTYLTQDCMSSGCQARVELRYLR